MQGINIVVVVVGGGGGGFSPRKNKYLLKQESLQSPQLKSLVSPPIPPNLENVPPFLHHEMTPWVKRK